MKAVRIVALPEDKLADVAHDALDSLIKDFRQPAFRVQFLTSVLATVPCARARLPFLPSFAIAMAAGYAARWVYTSASEALESMARIELQVGAREAGDV